MRGESGGPIVGLREGEAVELVGNVDPAPGIDVLEPGATHVTVLLEHGHVHPGLAQPVGRREPRGAGPDDATAESATAVGDPPRRGAGVGALERELFDQELLPGGGRVPPDQEVEDPPASLRAQCGWRLDGRAGRGSRSGGIGGRKRGGPNARAGAGGGAGAGAQGVARELPCRGLLFGGETVPRDEQLALVQCEVLPQQVEVAGQVGHRAQERVHLGGRQTRHGGAGLVRPLPRRLHSFSKPTGARPRAAERPRRQSRPMCLASWSIWLIVSTERGSFSMASARLSAVQRSSLSTESTIDHPA